MLPRLYFRIAMAGQIASKGFVPTFTLLSIQDFLAWVPYITGYVKFNISIFSCTISQA